MNQRPEYQKPLQRENKFFESILDFFHRKSSLPRLMLEVFIRKDFGDKYFNLGSAFSVFFVLCVLPLGLYWVFYKNSYGIPVKSFWDVYWSWYLFIALFVFFSIKRSIEVRRHKKDLNFHRNDPGTSLAIFYRIKLFGEPSRKIITSLYEPLAFFVLGFILSKLGVQIGVLIMTNSVFYSIGTYAEFHYGDNFFRDSVQSIVKGEDLKNSLESADINSKNLLGNQASKTNNEDETTFAL
ncbi:hypothetical protein [Ferruginibacter sp. HRS2-29]|uniref:hypothetical protein n=1 Tax=Ferruginibacter sp. HRS2-29 TaxID=2487334 RepID=UPI0020CF7DDE|nr:hypothetical protein [Ferruginibacter sp. HRS2-29]MCP9749995.1 hypothetical protein [Ferruginibacter sp. HRS2-29]